MSIDVLAGFGLVAIWICVIAWVYYLGYIILAMWVPDPDERISIGVLCFERLTSIFLIVAMMLCLFRVVSETLLYYKYLNTKVIIELDPPSVEVEKR